MISDPILDESGETLLDVNGRRVSAESILPGPSGFQETIYVPQIRTEFEGNYVHIRRRATRPRRKFAITYAILNDEEYRIFEELFLTYSGSAFYFIHPVTLEDILVTFSEDTFTSEFITGKYRRLSFTLEEL